MIIYGVLDSNDCHIDISLSLKGTKRVATKNRYKTVSARSFNSGAVWPVAEKINGKWKTL